MTGRRSHPSSPRDPRGGSHTRLEQSRAAQQDQVARFTKYAATQKAQEQKLAAERAARPIREPASYVAAVTTLPLYEVGQTAELRPSIAYRKLAAAAIRALNERSREAVLCWPAGDPSPAAVTTLLSLADCAVAKPITSGEYQALAAPIGLRALIYPYARTTHRALRHVLVSKDYLGRLHIKHQTRTMADGSDAALTDYHKTLARVGSLTGRATDGKEYDEFRHPCLDELVPSGPCKGTEGRSSLLWRVGTKTDLRRGIARTGSADQPDQARFYLFGLRAMERAEPALATLKRLDLVLLDLDSTGRGRLGPDWLARTKTFLAAVQARFGEIAVLALTDDPFSFDALRYDGLTTGPRRRGRREPVPSTVVFATDNALAEAGTAAPPEFANVSKWEALAFGGETAPILADLRTAARRADDLGDTENCERLRSVANIIRRCVCLPGALSELADYVTEETGEAAAADMAASYRVAPTLQELRQSHGAYPQHAHAHVDALCSRVEEAWGRASTVPPMASLVRDVVARHVRASSKTIVLFPKDLLADFAQHRLSQDAELGELVERKIDKGMLAFVDRAGLDDIAALPGSQRNQFKTLIVVAPPRSGLLNLLARPWLPSSIIVLADSDTLGRSAQDAARLGKYQELATVAGRLRDFANHAEAEASRVGNVHRDLPDESETQDDVDFPLSGVVNLAGRLRQGQSAIRLDFDGGQVIIARPGTRLVLQDRGRTVPVFTEVDAKSVDAGDRICVIGDAFLDMARPILNITARAAEEIRDYHQLVLDRFNAVPGASHQAKLANLVRAMNLRSVSATRAAYWLELDEQMTAPLHEVVPHAPRDIATFRAFMMALGVSQAIADRFWVWAVIAQRTSRVRAAMSFHDAYRSILVDTYAAESGQPERTADIRRLRAVAENFVSTVRKKSEWRGDDVGA